MSVIRANFSDCYVRRKVPPESGALSVSYVPYKYGGLIKIPILKVGVMIGQWRLSSEAFSQSFNNSPTTFINLLVGPVCAHTLMCYNTTYLKEIFNQL